jgi:tetratricopeptide (TPR) repeat protein
MYQKGRLLIHRGNHQKAIKLLYSFTDTYQEHPYRGNAFFWIGEALYSLGHFEEARRLFTTVVQDYPRSYKVEAARYRLSLIDFKKRERELLKLLRISHEEYLKALEQFRRQEKEYEHAISSYQRRLAAAVSEDDNALISELNREIEEQRSTIQQLSRENEELRRELSDLRGAEEQQRDEQQEPLPAEEQKPEEEEAAAEELTKKTDRELLEDLLELKSEALSQKADYLRQLRNREGDS